MMKRRVSYLVCVLTAAINTLAPAASAQPLGAFYWQLRPFCNVIALHITQHVIPPGAVYALTGFDDQCGATEWATLVGTATFNHDGSVGVGLTIIVAPGGTPVHVDARISLASLSGPWVDSAENAGTFVPVSGAVTGPLCPVPRTASRRAASRAPRSRRAQLSPSQLRPELGSGAGGEIAIRRPSIQHGGSRDAWPGS